jgi:hypothetical protein
MDQSSLFHMFSAPTGAPGNALLNWRPNSAAEIATYAWSYRGAAAILISSHRGNKFDSIDERALPILFLYRHASELYLKALVYRAAVVSIAEEELMFALPKLWREHSLVRLLEMSFPLLRSRYIFMWDDELEEKIGRVAKGLDEVDAGSYSFRYPVTSKGQPSLPTHMLTNIFVFSEILESVLDDLSEICRFLESKRVESSAQMKLALHTLKER